MIIVVVMLLFGVTGGFIAAGKGRSFLGWSVICFFTGFIGIIILLLMSSATQETNRIVEAINNTNNGQQALMPTSGYDEQKWANLKRFDPDIAAAAAKVLAVSADLERELAQAYLSIGDKSYLSAIVEKLLSGKSA